MSDFFTPIPLPLWPSDKSGFASALGQSFRETGFAVISEHGLDDKLIARTTRAAEAFFALPGEIKQRYFDPGLAGQRGYTPFATENAKGRRLPDLKEFWHTGRPMEDGPEHTIAMMPTPSVKELDDFDGATRALYDALDTLGQTLLRAVALHLGLAEDWFSPRVSKGNSILRLLHYPPQAEPPPPGSFRAAAHEDIDVITLLLGAEEAGLEVKHRSGTWLPLNPAPGTLVVNVGDMLQRLTCGVLPSTTHRVVNPSVQRANQARYALPFFLHFAPDVLIKPLEICLSDGPAPPPIRAQDYLNERLAEIGLIQQAN